jgi:hypothetical protein
MPSIGKAIMEGAANLFGSGERQGSPAKQKKPVGATAATGVALMAEKSNPSKAKAVADYFKK